MKNRFFTLLLLAASTHAAALESVSLQLRWTHQFQFAGYYAAVEKGFYQEAGLDVTLLPNGPDKKLNTIETVLQGDADFGVANSGLVSVRVKGEPVVALASIFQHSPIVWLVTDPNIRTIHDLVSKRIMIQLPPYESIELLAPFIAEGIAHESLNLIQTSFSVDSLINGETDAFNAYTTNEPFYLLQHGVTFHTISPRTYGIDFYGDVLFTTEKTLSEKPKLVQRFRDASLKGWQYAMEHTDEMIELIHRKYAPHKSIEHLHYEASRMQRLILPQLVEIGHMNPGRWQHIAQVHASFGLIPAEFDLSGFLYDPTPKSNTWMFYLIIAASALAAVVFLMTSARYYKLSRRLMLEISNRKKIEAKLHKLVLTDYLTGVRNRRHFYQAADTEHQRFERYHHQYALVIVDIDYFKRVNDDYGHLEGDKVLYQVAMILQNEARKPDTVARIGGEEFVYLLPETSLEEAQIIAERVRKQVEATTILLDDGRTISVTVSIGIAIATKQDQQFEQVLTRADQALYKAKAEGRNKVCLSH